MAEAPRRRSGGKRDEGPKSAPRVRSTPTKKPATAAVDPVAPDRGGNGWLELVTTLVQAPVGMGRAQAERLVGELVKSQGKAQSAADGFDRFIENRIEDVLNRLNIPSRSDIDRLHRSVDLLTTKVEALLKKHERSTP